MPSWGEVLALLQEQAAANNGQVDLDGIRRGFLARLSKYTGRSTVVFATDCLSPSAGGPAIQIILGDMQGLMEVFRGLPARTWT
jgi:hypothetical protein